jgi:hypothetical protein
MTVDYFLTTTVPAWWAYIHGWAYIRGGLAIFGGLRYICTKLKEAVQATLEDKFPDIKSLTDHQYRALSHLIDRKDVVCILRV